MKRLFNSAIFLSTGLFLILTATTIVEAQSTANNANTPEIKQSLKQASGRFLIKFKDGSVSPEKAPSIASLNKKHKVKSVKNLFFKDSKSTLDKRLEAVKTKFAGRAQRAGSGAQSPDLSKIFLVEVPQDSNINDIILEYAQDPNVTYVQPDYELNANLSVNDPNLSSAWGVGMVHADQAWDITMGENTLVAIVDTGIDYNHADLAANVWLNPLDPANGLDDDGNGYVDDLHGWNFNAGTNNVMDGNSHGTHVAGTIAAVANNNIGVAGVAPKAKLMAVKGLADDGSGYSSHLAQGIIYAAMNGADVINNSWGCASACPSNPVVEDAVRMAYSLGAVVVFAAGNSAQDVADYSPAFMNEVIAVAASDKADMAAYFTNFGALVDVAAPGMAVYSTIPNNGYIEKSGTSMAAPHVSGLAALMLAQHPTYTNNIVRIIMEASAADIIEPGFDRKSGHGRIDAFKALNLNSYIETAITKPTNKQMVNISNGSTLTVEGKVNGLNFKEYSLEYKKVSGTVGPWTHAYGPVMGTADGILGTIDLSLLSSADYLVRVVAKDTMGNEFDAVTQFNLDNPTAVLPCTRANPTMEDILGRNYEHMLKPGITEQFYINLTNNNSIDCPDTLYSLSTTLPSGWSQSIVSGITVASTKRVTFYWNVTPPLNAVNGSTYQFIIKATDTVDPTYTSSVTLLGKVNTDTTPPVVAILSPLNGSTLVKGRISVKVSASDSAGIKRVLVFVDGKYMGDAKGKTPTYTWDATMATTGSHIIESQAYDNNWNLSSKVGVQVNLTDSSGSGGTTRGRK